jgi:hypothetical protein
MNYAITDIFFQTGISVYFRYFAPKKYLYLGDLVTILISAIRYNESPAVHGVWDCNDGVYNLQDTGTGTRHAVSRCKHRQE